MDQRGAFLIWLPWCEVIHRLFRSCRHFYLFSIHFSKWTFIILISDYLKKQKRYYYLEKQKYEQKMYHMLNYVLYKNSSIPSMDGMLLHHRFNPSSRLRAIWGGGGEGWGGVHMSLSSLSQIQLFHILRSRPFPWRYLTYLCTVGRLMPFSSSLMCSCFKAKLLVRIYPKRASMLSVFIYTPGWRETKWSKVSSLRTQSKGKAWTWPSWS